MFPHKKTGRRRRASLYKEFGISRTFYKFPDSSQQAGLAPIPAAIYLGLCYGSTLLLINEAY